VGYEAADDAAFLAQTPVLKSLPNQSRLLLPIAFHGLFWLLRRHLRATELETVQVNTLRLKLLKI
jgi:hypothetical protein